MTEQHPEERRVVVNDRRRIDPETGAPRVASPGAAGSGSAPGPAGPAGPRHAEGHAPAAGAAAEEIAATKQALAERTADLQRVTAEYANYRKRVDRDRAATVEAATGVVLAALLPVLDDIDRARQHGDLTGAFKAVADQLEATLEKLGLQPYGEVGERFDPTLHEAVAHQTSAEVDRADLRGGAPPRLQARRPAAAGAAGGRGRAGAGAGRPDPGPDGGPGRGRAGR